MGSNPGYLLKSFLLLLKTDWVWHNLRHTFVRRHWFIFFNGFVVNTLKLFTLLWLTDSVGEYKAAKLANSQFVAVLTFNFQIKVLPRENEILFTVVCWIDTYRDSLLKNWQYWRSSECLENHRNNKTWIFIFQMLIIALAKESTTLCTPRFSNLPYDNYI